MTSTRSHQSPWPSAPTPCPTPPYYTMHASQMPALQFTDADIRRGAVKVVARSPSGQLRPLTVQADASGQYTTNFTPNEVGDWSISILYDNANIDGSPFTVRVYDPNRVKVFGLKDGGGMGQPVSFSVNADGAGDGELTVEVTYNGLIIPAHMEKSGPGNTYSVAFMPEGTGVYNIQVFFARVEVPGSPFIVDIANPACVLCTGDGLVSAREGFRASFLINCNQNAVLDDIAVRIMPPSGPALPGNLVDLGGGVFRAEFTPNVVGDHTIDVNFHGTAVTGSPFTCKVFNADQIIVNGIPPHTFIGRKVEFSIDASDSGNGQLEIIINDATVPCKVENIGNRKYRASFTPTEAINHVVRIVFNEHEVAGSPWNVEVRSVDGVHTNASELQMLPVNHVASFEVHSEFEGNLHVTIINTSGCKRCPLETTITEQCHGSYLVQFTPTEIGTYQIMVTFEKLTVSGTPSNFCAFDPSAISVSKIEPVAVGEHVEFTVDAAAAGMGELTIVVNHGNVPSSARLIGQSVYAVSFLPTEAGLYTVELAFNDIPLNDSPLTVSVVDAGRVAVTGPKLVPVGKLAVIKAKTQAAGKAALTAVVTSPRGKELPLKITNGVNCYDIEFTPLETGTHEVNIEYGGQDISHEPFSVIAYDVSRIRVMGIRDTHVGCKPSTFIVDLNKCGEGELNVSVLSALGHPVPNEVNPIEPGRLEVKFSPTEPGIHFAEITFNSEHVAGSPFKFNVHDPASVSVRGDGLDLVQCNQKASFIINAPEAALKDIDVTITGPNDRHIIPDVTETKPSTFLVEYTPRLPGVHQIDIHYFGCLIPGGPHASRAWDASRILIADVKQSQCGVESSFNVELGDAGDGTIEITINGPSGQLIANQVVSISQGLLEVHYIPPVPGMYNASVTYNGVPVPGSPAQFKVIDVNKVCVRGDGLGLVQCGRPASFVITAPDAKLSDIDVAITSPSGKELIPNISESAGGNYRVEYTPTAVGTYTIRVGYFDKEIACSPFVAQAWDASRVLLADVSMGQVGIESSFKVVVTEAGEGVLEITLHDPLGHLVANQVVSSERGILDVVFMPKVGGIHRGSVTFNGEKVPASPFTFLVIDLSSVSCWNDGSSQIPARKPTCFHINAPQAQLKDISVRIVGPNGQEVLSRVTESGAGAFKVDYTPQIVGEHFANVFYYGKCIPSCPMSFHVWDISMVHVSPISMGFCGVQSQFTVNAQEAGNGKLEVNMTAPQGQRVACDITTDNKGAFVVSYIPTYAGQHRADVLFNGEKVSGSPFTFIVADPENVTVTGEGVDLVRCNKPTSFVICAPAGRLSDLNVKITGPNHKVIHSRVQETSVGNFLVEYTPNVAGDYSIVIKYFDDMVRGSPFTARAWDPAGVIVSNIRPGIIAHPSTFDISPMNAGSGSLEITVTCRGENIPNSAKASSITGEIEVSFIPKYIDPHYINIHFNGQPVPGSPYIMPVLDGGLATASGPGLGHVVAGKPTTFNVVTGPVGGNADLAVCITSPTNKPVPAAIDGTPAKGYLVTYTPVEAGIHTVQVQYADVSIRGSPFSVDVFDPTAVQVIGAVPSYSFIGKPVSFKVDSSLAGHGHVTTNVKGHVSQPGVTGSGTVQGIYSFSFVPTESAEHLIFVYFNNINIPGSPFSCHVADQKNLQVNWESIRLRPVGKPVDVDLRTDSTVVADVSCTVRDPFGRDIVTDHQIKPRSFLFTFVPQDVGPHVIDLRYGTESVPGSPYTCNVYDSQRVRIIDATPCANVGDDVQFTVDTSEAGMGDIDVQVTQGSVGVPVQRHQLSTDLVRFSFIARTPKDHFINVAFNNEMVPVCPLVLRVVNPANKMLLSNGNAAKAVQVGETVWAVVSPPGYPIFPEDIVGRAIAPGGDIVPVTISQLTDGSVKIEYRSTFIGPHTLDVEYAGQLIHGSPMLTEIFDPSKILLEGSRCAKVGDHVIVDVNRSSAGQAELNVTVTDPAGSTVPFDVELTQFGERIMYIPTQAGSYKVNVTYGGLNVPGCPVKQEISAATVVTAIGAGLEKGVVDRVAEFTVNVKGERGELLADVQGPTSMARCTIEPDAGGRLKVKYVPTEVGIYTILMSWNGVEVDGCPFHPRIVDPSSVLVIDGQDHWTAVDRLKVNINEMHNIVFDCQNAGPGTLKVTVEGPDGEVETDLLPVNTDVNLNQDCFVLKFLPRKLGDYYVRAYWCDMPIELFPIIVTVMEDINPPPPAQPPPIEPPPIKASMVSVHGPGISLAYLCDPTEFVIDGHEGGPGVPDVKMVGLKCDIDVLCFPVDDNVYGCSYVPEVAGAYLLSVLWSGQHVPGSPFKVSVMSTCDAGKVHCSGDALTTAFKGRDNSILIDARRAGCGELVAQCNGPCKMAYCNLLDRHDGSFELLIRPQEVGLHVLDIKYGGEPVPGSPFNVKVIAAPDPTKVRVTGDGVMNGLLATFQSTFQVDTRGAGPGQLTVKVRGPKGAFRVEMTRQPGNDRCILCRYYPMEIGVYQVYVLWSGEHVTGSPFRVHIVDTLEQLRHLEIHAESANIQGMLVNGFDSVRSSGSGTGSSDRYLMFNDDL